MSRNVLGLIVAAWPLRLFRSRRPGLSGPTARGVCFHCRRVSAGAPRRVVTGLVAQLCAEEAPLRAHTGLGRRFHSLSEPGASVPESFL